MYHSIIIRVDGRFVNTWDDWHLIPSSRPVIAPPQERTNFVTVGGRDGVLDFSQTLSGRPVFDNRSGSIEFYVENDYWDWETAYTTICETLQGKRIKMALEDNPSHYYEGLLYVDKWTSDKGHSKISLKYNLHPTMLTLDLDTLEFVETELAMTPGMVADLHLKVSPSDTFYRKVTVTAIPAGIVRITDDSLVEAIQNGVTEILAVCGPKTTVCRVTVADGTWWNITKDLHGCTETNHANKIQNGAKYENILTAPDGYTITQVKIRNAAGGSEGTIAPEANGTTAKIGILSVTKDITVEAVLEAIPVYNVIFDLDCVTAVEPAKTVRKGQTVKFKIKGVSSDYVLDQVTVEMDGYERYDRVTWDSLNEATITLTVDGDITIRASALAYFTLEECSWGMIDRIARSGKAADYFSVGDRKSVKVRPISGNALYSSSIIFPGAVNTITLDAFILGINHNPGVEGKANIHFGLGKNGLKLTTAVNTSYINKEANNTTGILGSELMAVIGTEVPPAPTEHKPGSTDTPYTPDAVTLLWWMPRELTRVMRKAPKTAYDTSTKAMVTTNSYLWLLSEVEVFGTTTHGYSAEAYTQKQYTYFADGNRTLVFDRSGEAVMSWLRSPTRDTKGFCRIKKDGSPDYGWSYDKESALLGFALGADTTSTTDGMILDRSVLG